MAAPDIPIAFEERLLAALRRRGPAIVADVAQEVGAPPRALESILLGLMARGAVRRAWRGTPPVAHWELA